MTKNKHQRTRIIAALGLFIILCIAWGMAPLWVNPCDPTHLSEEEIEQTREFPNYRNLSLEQRTEADQLHRKAEIPCGAQDLPVREKLDVSHFGGMILGELRGLRPAILRVEFVGMVENTDLYHYKGYTFFFIPIFDAVGGGSGYMEITPFPFLHGGK